MKMDAKIIHDEQNISILKKDKIQRCTCKILPPSPPPPLKSLLRDNASEVANWKVTFPSIGYDVGLLVS